MTTMNPFDLLGDNDNDDPSILIETVSAQLLKSAEISAKNNQPLKPAKLPTKPVPPTQAVREARNENGRGGGRGFEREGGRGFGRDGGGRGRGRGGYNRDYSNNENGFNNNAVSRPQGDEGERTNERRSYDAPRGSYRGGRRGGYNNDEGRDGDRPRRTYERHSGTGRGSEFKREGAGRGNWGNQSDEVAPEEVVEETEKIVSVEDVNAENLPVVEEAKDDKEAQPEETEKKEPEEDKEMTLEEYLKVQDEKRKDLLASKPEERKVKVDKDLQSMQQLSNKREDESVFIKLGSDKEKKKEVSEKEKTKKIVSINEFLKPADGDMYYSPGGRGRGRGRGPRGGGGGGGGGSYGGGNRMNNTPAPIIKDQEQFPTLGAPRAA